MADKVLGVGATAGVKATPVPPEATLASCSWSTGDPAVMTVTPSPTDPTQALLGGVAPGIVTLAATGVDGAGNTVSDQKTVEVAAQATGLVISFL